MMRGFMFHPKFLRLVIRAVIFCAFYLSAVVRGNLSWQKVISMIWRVLSHVGVIGGWFSFGGGSEYA